MVIGGISSGGGEKERGGEGWDGYWEGRKGGGGGEWG